MEWWESAPLAKPADPQAPQGAQEWWKDAPMAPQQTVATPEVPKIVARETADPTVDYAKVVLTTPQEGAARFAGMPGDVLDLVNKADKGIQRLTGMDKVAGYIQEKLGMAEPTDAQRAEAERVSSNVLPTTQDIKHGVNSLSETVGGPSLFYNAQTPKGKILQEALAGAISGRPFGRTAALSNAMAGTAGEGTRQVFEDTPLEGPASLTAALLAGSLPSAARSLGAVSRPGDILARALENVSPAEMDEAQRLQTTAAGLGVPLTGPEAIQQVQGQQTRLGTLQRAVEQAPTGEVSLRPFMAARPGQVEAAGRTLMRDTFGNPVAPEVAANTTQKAAEDVMARAVKSRTETTQPKFTEARTQSVTPAAVDDIETIKKDIDAEIALTGADNPLGKKLQKYRDLLDQPTEGGKLGPLVETNRTYAENLYKKYNPLDPENTFNNREVAALAPFNQRLQGVLETASPAYKTGLATYKDTSQKVVNPLEEGAIGRLMTAGGENVSSRVKAMADEFLNPETTRPDRIQALADQLGTVNPSAVRHLVGARMENIFNDSVKTLQSGPNPWGGAKFVTTVMGNPQARANLRATIEALPNGKSVWPGWVKFTQVMEATGKRLPRGSDTAANLGMSEELKGATSVASKGLTSPLGVAGDVLENWAYRANARELGKVFTAPDSVKKMRQLAILNPASRKAQLLAAEIMAAVQNQREDDR